MNKNFFFVTASIVALGAAAPAFGADLAARHQMYTKAPPASAALYDWSGFYIGGNGGWGNNNSSWDLVGVGPEGSHDANGATAGGQIGYRWQMGQLVFGVEGQGNWADFKGSNASLVAPGFTNHTKTDAFGLITGQIGYAFNNVLLYANGGAAVTGNSYRVFGPAGALAATGGDDTRWGGAIGAGVEVGFAPNWSVGVQYDHLFMQDSTIGFTTPAGFAFASDRISQDIDVVTARINYKFGGPIIGRY
ncbi:outer membrane beta-barrel protein [Bradyrhizobium sp. Tv2a-2]|uniref:outer membrane protein n=1 Tax=Bradyrhizobium sp. Tv2a-2 TaxID=113395 RepID=UPI0004142C77|nr:outer membrane beta-barrel protein [Bradyrhizobium sp. Tv2a-2]